MTTPVTQIAIPFRPLLAKITECMEFPEPEYNVVNLEQNSGSVTVKVDYEPVEHLYIGGASTTLEESYEKAAQTAVRDLIIRFDIYINDFTAAKKQMYERCTNLWRFKRLEMDRLGKGLSKIPLEEEFVFHEIYHLHHVAIDIVSILMTITEKLPIECTSIHTIEHTPSSFTSWLDIDHNDNKHEHTCIISDTCTTSIASQRDLAHKAIQYLTPLYNVEIIDANYAPEELKFVAFICESAKKKFLTLEKHALEVQKGLLGTPELVKEDCTTPKGVMHSIPLLKSPPPPPRKRKSSLPTSSKANSVPDNRNISFYTVPPYDITGLYKNIKFA